MIRRVRFGLAGTVGALALFVSLAAASPALATTCGGSPVDSIWNAVGSQAYVKTCLYFGWAGDNSKIASRAINAGEDQNTNSNSSYVNVYTQTCLWISTATRIGCSPYEWLTPGSQVTYQPGLDYAPNWYCARTWVSGTLIRTLCDYGA